MKHATPWESQPDEVYEPEGSKLEIWFPAEHIVCTRITGHFIAAFADTLIGHFDRAMRTDRPIVVWHDWGDATGYDTRVKVDFTTWAVKRASSIERVHVYASSTFLRLAIKVSNLATGNRMRVFDSRDALRRSAWEYLQALEGGGSSSPDEGDDRKRAL